MSQATYAQWKARVSTYLDVDANRRGIESLRASLLRAAILDMKHFIPCFRDGRSQSYDYADGDITLFSSNETAAQAAAAFIKARITRSTDKDLSLSMTYRKDYADLRRQLVRDCIEQKLSHAITDSGGEATIDSDGHAITDDRPPAPENQNTNL